MPCERCGIRTSINSPLFDLDLTVRSNGCVEDYILFSPFKNLTLLRRSYVLTLRVVVLVLVDDSQLVTRYAEMQG
jgi:hypothetical protein